MINEIVFPIHLLFVFACAVGAFLRGPFVLQTLVALYVVFANLFVIKKMVVAGLLVGGCDAYIIGSMCGILMGRELWGLRFARDAAQISIAVSIAFLILSWFHVQYVPIPTDGVHSDFMLTIGRMPLVTLFSLAAHYIAQMLTLFLVNVLSRLTRQRYAAVTAFIAMMIGQLVDSLLFLVGAFGISMPVPELLSMVVVSTTFKVGLVAMGSLLIGAAAWCRRNGYVQ